MPSARLYIPEKIYHEMREKGYLKAVPIGNILEIGIAQYDQWVAEGLDPNERLVRIELGPEVSPLSHECSYASAPQPLRLRSR
jgi:hypothetical protein